MPYWRASGLPLGPRHAARRPILPNTITSVMRLSATRQVGELLGKREMIRRADAAAHDQRRCAHAAERRDRIAPPPEEGQGHGNEPRAQNAEQREHVLHGVRHLHRHDRVGMQPYAAQPPRNG